jgi:hypothetical protein
MQGVAVDLWKILDRDAKAGREMSGPHLEVVGETMRVRFDCWDSEAYALFLRTKSLPEHSVLYDEVADAYTVEAPARFARLLGVVIPRVESVDLPMPEWLFDYQAYFVRVALEAKRYAAWWDTGLGKTSLAFEWCRQVLHRTQGRVLYVVPLNLIPQVLADAEAFYGGELTFRVLESRADLRAWCRSGSGLALTNPEKFLPRKDEPEVLSEITYLSGVALDESSLLKTGGGRMKWAIIKSCRGVEFKISLTATPAPNDPIEYASQAAFLEKIRDEGEVIWTYFIRDKEGEWKIKEHALPAFYRFLSGWSCYVRHPARYGFGDNLKDLQDPERLEYVLSPTDEQLAAVHQIPDATGQTSLVDPERLGIVERGRLSQISSGFLYQSEGLARRIASPKPGFISDLIRRDVAAGLQVIVWTFYDETVEILREELADASFGMALVTGSVPTASRPAIVEAFKSGAERVLISRPEVLGFGANLQCAGSVIWADLNDSYEQMYQGDRRAYRYGQTKRVRIHCPRIAGLQDAVWSNLQSKAAMFERDVARMERLYIEAMQDLLPREEIAA